MSNISSNYDIWSSSRVQDLFAAHSVTGGLSGADASKLEVLLRVYALLAELDRLFKTCQPGDAIVARKNQELKNLIDNNQEVIDALGGKNSALYKAFSESYYIANDAFKDSAFGDFISWFNNPANELNKSLTKFLADPALKDFFLHFPTNPNEGFSQQQMDDIANFVLIMSDLVTSNQGHDLDAYFVSPTMMAKMLYAYYLSTEGTPEKACKKLEELFKTLKPAAGDTPNYGAFRAAVEAFSKTPPKDFDKDDIFGWFARIKDDIIHA